MKVDAPSVVLITTDTQGREMVGAYGRAGRRSGGWHDLANFLEYGRFGIGSEQTDGFFPIRCVHTADWELATNLFNSDELYHLAEESEAERNLIDDPACALVRNDLHDRLPRAIRKLVRVQPSARQAVLVSSRRPIMTGFRGVRRARDDESTLGLGEPAAERDHLARHVTLPSSATLSRSAG
jgi:hypothetical protein